MQHRQQLTDPWVGAVGANRHREMITEVADGLIDRWIDNDEVSFVPGFAKPLPQTVITRILGFPLEDMPMLREWEEAQVRRFVFGATHRSLLTPEEERRNAEILVQFQQYIQDRVTEKRRNPQDDMTTFLTQVRYGDDQRLLTDGEVISVVYGMHIGGNETTQYALTAQAQLLAQQPALFAELKADRSKVRAFVEESLRLLAPTQGLSSRTAMEDAEFRGVRIPKGSLLHLRYGAGNRDEENFPQADRIDLERPTLGRHLTFSQGPRICPGAGLSRLEQTIAINLWLDRIESWELAPGKNTLAHQPGIMLGLLELHLRFTKA
jgi:cytochrome P450